MNKIFKVKRNSAGQSVVCSEIAKSRTKGRVVASALAVAVAGLMASGGVSAATGEVIGSNPAMVQGETAYDYYFDSNNAGAIEARMVSTQHNFAIGAGSGAGGYAVAYGPYSKASRFSQAVGRGATALYQSQSIGDMAISATDDGENALSSMVTEGVLDVQELRRAHWQNYLSECSVGRCDGHAAPTGSTAIGGNSVAISQVGDYASYITLNPAYAALSEEDKSQYHQSDMTYRGVLYSNGQSHSATLSSSVAIGGASAAINGSVALGAHSNAQKSGVAMGENTSSLDGSVAIGSYSNANSKTGVSVGFLSDTLVDGGVAMGSGSVASTKAGEIGYLAQDGSSDAIWVSTGGAVSVGAAAGENALKGMPNSYLTNGYASSAITRQITNVAAGTADTDAVNVAQLKVVKDLVDTKADKTYVDAELAKKADKTDLDALKTAIDGIKPVDISGKADKADVDAKNATQDAAIAANTDAIKALDDKKADKADLEALKENITTSIQPALDAKADKADVDAKNAAQDALIAKKANQSALDATNDKLNALDNAAVKYDDPAAKDKVTLGGAGGTTITNVKAGELSASSTDAVNGSQLFATNQTIAANKAAQDAKNAELDATNAAQDALIATKADKTYVDAQDAALGNRIDTLNNNMNTGLDAVNDRVDGLANVVNNNYRDLTGRMNSMDRRLTGGIANAIAFASLPTPYQPGTHHVMFGTGYHDGIGAIAIGATGTAESGSTSYKLGMSWSNEAGVSAGVGGSYRWR